jgi:chromosomal replication initiator protein
MSVKLITLEHPQSRRSTSAVAEHSFLTDFVVGPENQELLHLFSNTDRSDLANQSPIVLFGPSGVGKSAVAQSLASRWIRQFELGSYSLTSGIDFARQYALAIDSDDMDHFRVKHRQCELLIVDGIHDLIGRESAQDELIHSMDALRNSQALVLITTPKIPGSYRELRPQLTSRLSSGLCIEMSFPGLETRIELIQQIASKMSISISPDEQLKLARELPDQTSAYHLRGLLIQYVHQQRVAPDRPPESTLDQLIETQQLAAVPSLQEIAKSVSKSLSVKLSDLRGQTRKASVVRARGLAILLARQLTGHSFQQIGEYFGGRDHTTIMHSLRKTESDLAIDPELTRAHEEIRQSLARVR